MQRRLAAILIADVVGYTRHSQVDEMAARAHFNADLREVFEPKIAQHSGRLVKTMGDGLLVEFPSVIEALACAVEIQRSKAERTAGMSTDRRMDFRIGINLGDVIVEGDDIHGDGVNIADRLQRLAEPGGIAISGTTYDHVRGKLDVAFDFRGEQRVKNVAEPVRVYRVLAHRKDAGRIKRGGMRRWRRLEIAAALGAVVIAGMAAIVTLREDPVVPAPARPDKPSIAVLPFANMSGDAEQAYFADGMTDDLITDLSQISGLFVIARNSTFSYKGKSQDVREIARELGVRYVLEGSVQRAGEQVRVNAQLIDADTGGHLWADRYDGSLSDVFRLQDKVTRSIADALALRLTAEQQQTMSQKETKIPAAYDAFLRGWDHFRRATMDDYAQAIRYFEQAIAVDPDYGRAYAALALVQESRAASGWHRGEGDFTNEISRMISRNLGEAEKHPTSTYYQAAGVSAADIGLYRDAVDAFTKAIALDPSDSWSYAYMARLLTFWGKPADAVPYIQTAMRVDPHYPPVFLSFLGLAQFSLEQYERAAVSLETATSLNREDAAGFLLLGATYGHLGRKQEAQSAVAAFDALMHQRGIPPITATYAWGTWGFVNRPDRDRLFDGLLLAGVPERLPSKLK